MTANQKLQKAKVRLLMREPFFACLSLRLNYSADQSIKTACTNGKEIRYNPAYIERLNMEELVGVIVHEILHIVMHHHTRRKNRNVRRWNKAADYAINPLVLDQNIALPKNCLYDSRYRDQSAEYIYDQLPEDDACNEPDGLGDVSDFPQQSLVQRHEMEIKQAIVQAKMIAQKQGKLPACLDRLIQAVLHPKISWMEVLNRFVSEVARNDFSWKRPSPRYLALGLYLPVLESLEVGNIIFIVDTSGSITDTVLNQTAAEVHEVVQSFNMSLQILYVDAEVQFTETIDPDEPLHLHPKGGGGTDFRPGFQFIEQHQLNPKAVVYLTDGRCHHFPECPDYPVLWAKYGSYGFQPPFGDVIAID